MKTIVIIAMLFASFGFGYSIGFKNCFEYLKQKLKEFKEHNDG